MRRATLALLIVALVSCAVALLPRAAWAHDFKPGVLALVERGEGRVDVAFTRPVDTRAADEDLEVIYPAHCKPEGRHLACGIAGLHGELAFRGMRGARMQVVLRVSWRDGSTFDAIATSAEPRVAVHRAGSSSPGRWVGLGIQHVLTGLDHVAFVVGLFLVVGARRRLVGTITAFTLAHSLTLALAAVHVVEIARAPVEATIAASVLLVALEATHRRQTWTRAYPWLVAGLFGLVHGFGFAGALGEIGLPRSSLAVALGSFNVGVELAQLLVVGVMLALVHGARLFGPSDRRAALARSVTCYALGSLGAYWLFDRTFDMLQGR